jgi:uncharacterized membrane protein
MKSQFEQNEYHRMRNNPDNYKWGIFYFNPQDPRFIVPKRIQYMGWTFNFAHPLSYLIIFGLILFAIFMDSIGKI